MQDFEPKKLKQIKKDADRAAPCSPNHAFSYIDFSNPSQRSQP